MGSLRVKMIVWYVGVASFVLAVLMGVVYLITVKRFIGRAPSEWYTSEKTTGLNVHDLLGGQRMVCKASDGTQLSLLVFIRPGAQRTVLVTHGYHMTKEELFMFPLIMKDDNVVLLDLRAHGGSQGDLITFGYYEVFDMIGAAYGIKVDPVMGKVPLYGIGISMGGVALLGAAMTHPELFTAIIIDSVFSYLPDQFARTFNRRSYVPRIPFLALTQWLIEYTGKFRLASVSPRGWISKLGVPVLLIHSATDKVTPVSDVHVLYACAQGTKGLWIAPEGGHGTLFRDMHEDYFALVNAFIRSHT